MGMETCKQQDMNGPQVVVVEENFITGPPASRSVIDNLKKLLTQRQHSRESDSENKATVLRSTSGSNSDTAFYSHLSSSTSDSDDSDPMLIFENIATPTRKTNSSSLRRRFRRHRSTSSSSSCSRSPVEKRRKKTVTRLKLTFTPMDETARMGKLVDNSNTNNSGNDSTSQVLITASSSSNFIGTDGLASSSKRQKKSASPSATNNDHSSAENYTSSHKDSSSDDENHERSDPSPLRYTKLKSRRDRDRKRSEKVVNPHHRPKILKHSGCLTEIPVILISPSTDYPDTATTTISQETLVIVEQQHLPSETTKDELRIIPVDNENKL